MSRNVSKKKEIIGVTQDDAIIFGCVTLDCGFKMFSIIAQGRGATVCLCTKCRVVYAILVRGVHDPIVELNNFRVTLKMHPRRGPACGKAEESPFHPQDMKFSKPEDSK